MRATLLIWMATLSVVAPAGAQERLGVSQQAQTVAPNVSLERPQPATCGAAPSASQINRLVPVIRRMFPQPGAFDKTLAAEIEKPCQRNRAANYLIHLIAANNWVFLPSPGLQAGYPPGSVSCRVSPGSADLNVVIAKMLPLFAIPPRFNANIAALAAQPCTNARVGLYLFGLMVDNNLAFRR